MPDVMVPEAHQNDRSYVRELNRLSIQDAKICHVGQLLHGVPIKPRREWALARDSTEI